MATWRLMDGQAGRPGDGPTSPIEFAGDFLAGTAFGLTRGGLWLYGYSWWVPPGGDRGAQKFACWNVTSSTPTQALVPGSTVTSGPLSTGRNDVLLAIPVPLAIGAVYAAATGWTAVNGFPDAQNQFGTGMPYAAGITNGPLTAYSDGSAGGTRNAPYSIAQGLFSSSLGNDPSAEMPNGGSDSSNFWVDVIVSDQPPAGYAGSWSLFPNQFDALGATADLAHNYILGTEITLSQPCAMPQFRYYSPATAGQLATDIGVWDVATQTLLPGTHHDAPEWSGTAGSGWVEADYATPPLIPPGRPVKLSAFNRSASPQAWNATTAGYFTTGPGAAGIVSGPITCPSAAAAAAPGQCTYQDTTGAPAFAYPDLYVMDGGQNYWLDAVLVPVRGSGLLLASLP